MTTAEVVTLGDAAEPRWRALILLAAGTGMRQGECLGLTLHRVDWLRRQVRVDRQLVQLAGQAPVFAAPKTNSSVRVLPLPQVVLDTLAEHVRQFPPGGDGLMFTTDDGAAVRRTSVAARIWSPTAKRAGVTGRSFHDLRHFYASLLIRSGESRRVVQARLGHQSAALTLNVYSHLWPDSEERTRAAIATRSGLLCQPRVTGGSVPALTWANAPDGQK